MKSKKKNPVDFKKLTPEMQIEKVKFSDVYRKSLLESQPKPESDYVKNTTTWD